jgi:hypothetical protein
MVEDRLGVLRERPGVASGQGALVAVRRHDSPRSRGRPMGRPDTVAVGVLLAESLVLVAVLRGALSLPLWYNEQWRAWHISRSLSGELWRQLPYTDSPIAVGWLLAERAATAAFGEVEAAYRWPVALCLPLLALTSYALARRWLGPAGSFLVAATLVTNPPLYGYAWQLAPYMTEAMLAPLAVLLWLKAGDWQHLPARRLSAYVGLGLCTWFGTAITFVVAPLLALDLVSHLRTRNYRMLGPTLVAGLLTVGHLAGFVLMQSKGAVREYWVGTYAPRSPAAVGFFLRGLEGWVPEVVTGPVHGQRALTVLCCLALASGSVVAVRDRRVRPLFVALTGALVLQMIASSLRLWAFGFLRINFFLIPLAYLLIAVGIAVPVRALWSWLRLAGSPAMDRLALAGVIVLAGVGMVAVVEAGTPTVVGLRNVVHESNRPHPYDGIRALVAATRQYVGPTDAVVFAQHDIYKNFKGWAYYMTTYSGWPPEVARRPLVPPERSLQIQQDDQEQVRRFLAAHSQTRQVLSVTMANAQGRTAESAARALRTAGFRPGMRLNVQGNASLTVWTFQR